ncbi:dyp-type peroxidase family protein [Lindgomyces ingoldianus]|uniref:Dyp-type peroxidase family protein n=1 Tax=Lindgomyces ingoldianus TaxID=673940 RepID=A0ACB6QHN5_9PLEO|nr:dyp-type peroxidase family protein [Lindgomyces ingoldianus]KAF2466088.1 dyp-type peroxidase family protein [Lindgomyces ingoldianus]
MALRQGTLQYAQKGLLMRAVFGQVWTIALDKKEQVDTRLEVLSILQQLSREIESKYQDCGLIAAFSPDLWEAWTNEHFDIHREVLNRNIKLKDTGGDVLLYVKGPSPERVRDVLNTVKTRIEKIAKKHIALEVGKRRDCRILGGRYLDSITNPNDPVSLNEDILLDEGRNRGGCFGFTQNFEIDWAGISQQTADSQDEMIGRNTDNMVIPQNIAQGHIHRANIFDENRDQRKLLRQALSYGNSNAHPGRETGIMFVAFCNFQPRFEEILKNLLGDDNGTPVDRLMQMVKGIGGSYWYVPSARQLKVSAVAGASDVYEDPHWQVSSPNGYMFYNTQDYLHKMGQGTYKGGDPPTPRLLSLLSRTFNHWRDGWLHTQRFPRLPPLSQFEGVSEQELAKRPVAVRKGQANYHTLADILSKPDSKIAAQNSLLRIEPNELIVGVIPDFTLGRGKEVMPYLDEAETMAAWLKAKLNEWSAMGHVVPDFQTLATKGLRKMIDELRSKLGTSDAKSDQAAFYQSTILSLKGVQKYMLNWAEIALKAAKRRPADSANMKEIAARLRRLETEPPRSFQDAVQLIFSFHCCLHLVGELTSLGRLDQILWPFLEKDYKDGKIKPERAQEIIDCLFLKIGENAFVDRSKIYDYSTYGTTSVNGVGGNFSQGGGINQWVQQITVGGYKATDDDVPQGGANEVTMLCLKAARRIPVNAPTLSLRVYKGMPSKYLDEAAKAILSGGAQPIMYNDDKLCEGLFQSGQTPKTVSRAWSRDYAADGCYEPMFAGASEFTFSNIDPMLALEQTINQGATYGAAGSEYLRGLKQTFRSPSAAKIKTFETLKAIFFDQIRWLTVSFYYTLLGQYGNLATVCPSPLLSTLIKGCIEKGRDHTNGGPKFHIIAPLCVGMSNTIDSLYAIKKLVYDHDSAMVTLPELVNCLVNDWGYNMQEPFQDQQTLDIADSAERGLRFQELRLIALALPKWGSGNSEVNALGEEVMTKIVKICNEVIKEPHPAVKGAIQALRDKCGKDFEFVVTPGIGTFEGYVGDGIPYGASADGRRNGMPIASDLSPVPAPQDLPPNPAFRNIYQSMRSVKNDAAEYGMSNASPVDMNITEDFPEDELKAFVRKYADGEVGGNLITLTCADLKTYQAATKNPEKYSLVRVRMGGWTEFYATMFEAHQNQHQRRQYFTPDDPSVKGIANGVHKLDVVDGTDGGYSRRYTGIGI